MKTNVHVPVYTHEGAKSTKLTPIQELKRTVMACMLWEDNFYEDGKSVCDRIVELCKNVSKMEIIYLAGVAHDRGFLRHIPLFLTVQALKKKDDSLKSCPNVISNHVARICSRPDQMTEFLSLYWKEGKKPLANQLKKGLALAFNKFDEYQLQKYNRNAPIKLRDVLFLCHAKPKDQEQEELWKRLISNTLKTPETWEIKLSSGKDKKESFKELLEKSKLGKLAILRNLRNMYESGVDKSLVKQGLMEKTKPMLPFQFLMASKHCPSWEDIIDDSMIQSMEGKQKLIGLTVVFVDVSGSMEQVLSAKSEVKRMDAAAGLSILLRETCENIEFMTFSERLVPIPNRRGMALRDAINTSQPHGSTYLGAALRKFMEHRTSIKVDRIIVITDEQSHDIPPKMDVEKKYILNVGCYQNGVKNDGTWMTISGFSESCIDYIIEIENEEKEDCKTFL